MKKYVWVIFLILTIVMMKIPLSILLIYLNKHFILLKLEIYMIYLISTNCYLSISMSLVSLILGLIFLNYYKKGRKKYLFDKKISEKEFKEIVKDKETEEFRKNLKKVHKDFKKKDNL